MPPLDVLDGVDSSTWDIGAPPIQYYWVDYTGGDHNAWLGGPFPATHHFGKATGWFADHHVSALSPAELHERAPGEGAGVRPGFWYLIPAPSPIHLPGLRRVSNTKNQL